MFKLLALRVLDGCVDYIQKCLKTDVYYYFCTDYRFEIQDKVCRGSRYSEPLHPAFFAPVPNIQYGEKQSSTLTINVNAIVGKNGDGKSTIVELIIRLVNNYIAKHLNTQNIVGVQPLVYVPGVCAELYFQQDDSIYRLFSAQHNEGLHLIAKVSAFRNEPTIQSVPRIVNQATGDVMRTIYTLVSNYSHYAYNMFDFHHEWVYEGADLMEEDRQNEIFWMHRIFHKNDGYITPLSIHPYRISGNIDINREAALSKQRLLYLFVKSTDEPNAFRNILGKKAIGIRLTPSGTNKLFDRSIKAFFLAHTDEDRSLDWAISPIKNTSSGLTELLRKDDNEHTRKEVALKLKNLNDMYFGETQEVLDRILLGEGFPGNEQVKYNEFLVYATKYVGKNGKVKQSSTSRFFNTILTIEKKIRDHYKLKYKADFIYQILPDSSFIQRYKPYENYNLQQIARLYTIFTIALRYGIDTTLLSKPFKNLSNKERAQLYKIYKIISIFETYPKYKEIIEKGKQKWGEDACYEFDKDTLSSLLSQLNKDALSGSHITRKLVQTDNYLRMSADIFTNELDLQISYKYLDKKSKIKDITCVEHYYGKQNVDIFHLIPPIFEYDIVLRDGDAYMELGTLSSGEKQLLNNIGAIIYHLQNIDAATIKYRAVNLILEEIELYFHPEYQRLFVNRLLDQIYGLGLKNVKDINITFVTHSPFVLSDVPKSNVLFLKDGKPDYEMQENTFGANIHSLLNNGFFLPNLPMGEFAYQKINELFRKLNDHQYDESEIPQIKQEISVIGEPYLREQLYKLLRNAQPS